MHPQQYYLAPIPVEAWKLDYDNLKEIAKWCKGSAKGYCISFPKIRNKAKIMNSEDTRSYAIVGQYIVKTNKGFKVMGAKEFETAHRLGTKRI